LVDAAQWNDRECAQQPPAEPGVGRELFAIMRHFADEAEKGGSAMLAEAGL
jgi:phosphogluconate dehydratase